MARKHTTAAPPTQVTSYTPPSRSVFETFVAKIRTEMLVTYPFFGTLAMYLKPICVPPDQGLWLAGVDGVNLFINYHTVKALPLPQQVFLFSHEVMHCALRHYARLNSRDINDWQYATDVVINNVLTENKMVMIPGGIYRPEFTGMSADEVYRAIQNERKDGADSKSEKFAEQMRKLRDLCPPNSDGCDNGDDEGEDDEYDNKPRTVPAVSELDMQWKQRIVTAANAARQRGRMPGGLDEIISDIVFPKVDWRTVLHQFLIPTYRGEARWSTPDRRFAQHGVYLPSAARTHSDYIVVAIDTSGSVSIEELTQFAAEIRSIQASFGIERIRVIACDAQITSDISYDPNTPVELHAKGRGGTEFDPVFALIASEYDYPRALVYLTDGECYSRLPAPPYPVLWVCTGKRPPRVGFGQTVYIKV